MGWISLSSDEVFEVPPDRLWFVSAIAGWPALRPRAVFHHHDPESVLVVSLHAGGKADGLADGLEERRVSLQYDIS